MRLILLCLLATFFCTCGRAQKTGADPLSLVVEYEIEPTALNDFWGKAVKLNYSVLLPSGYEDNPQKRYPVRYNIAGYGGRHTRVNKLLQRKAFGDWWTSAEAPQIITVFLDGHGPFGDPYQLNSANSGPYGDVLIKEIIPFVDKEYRTLGAEQRFTDGCSTGGWVSLALQLFYPEEFAACYSYSPDPVSFHRMQLIDVYEDKNAFFNERGIELPSKRDIYGEPVFSIKKEVSDENKKGKSGTYLDSGDQWGSWNALYSPQGENGMPKAIFDPVSGAIDKSVAEEWKKFDLLLLVKNNWETLGPKVQGKINVWMGDMDNYYLNNAMRDFDAYLKTTTHPTSDAKIAFEPMKGHCDEYSHRRVLEEIQRSLK